MPTLLAFQTFFTGHKSNDTKIRLRILPVTGLLKQDSFANRSLTLAWLRKWLLISYISLKLTVLNPENMTSQKEKIIFQSHPFFRSFHSLLVSGSFLLSFVVSCQAAIISDLLVMVILAIFPTKINHVHVRNLRRCPRPSIAQLEELGCRVNKNHCQGPRQRCVLVASGKRFSDVCCWRILLMLEMLCLWTLLRDGSKENVMPNPSVMGRGNLWGSKCIYFLESWLRLKLQLHNMFTTTYNTSLLQLSIHSNYDTTQKLCS